MAAIDAYLLRRPKPKVPAAEKLMFVTKYGEPWFKADSYTNPISQEFRKLLGDAARKGVNFYALRHSFRTIASAAKDEPAANVVMGHASGSMAEEYVESIEDDRLQAVVDYVHDWLFPAEDSPDGTKSLAKTPAKPPRLRIVG